MTRTKNAYRTKGFKDILVSPQNHKRLFEMANKTQIMDDIITMLLKNYDDNGGKV